MSDRTGPIFIVGCGHSGTSILLNLMGSHSCIFAIPHETEFAYRWREFGEEAKVFSAKWDEVASASGKQRWVEKTPRHIFRIRQILEAFPSGKVLLMIRDGRDVACSIQDRFGDLERGINRWVKDNREGESYWRHPNVCRVRYEELIDDPERALTGVMNFVGEIFEPSMLAYYEQPKMFYHDTIECPPNAFGENHGAFRNWQINQPLFDGRGKWRRMTPEEKELVKNKAGQMLIDYGYAADLNW